MKKICFILPSLSGGGAERVLLNLSNYFSQQEFSVDLVLVKKSGAYLKDVESKVNLIDFDKSRVLFSLFSFVNYFKQYKPDAVLVTMPHISLIVIMAKMLSGINTNLVIRQPNYLTLNIEKRWWNKFYLELVKVLFNKAGGVIGISQGVSNNLLDLGIQKVQTIHNPAVFPKIFELAKKTFAFPFDPNKKTFIAVGRLVKQKNFSLLVDAFAEVNKTLNVQLIILGEGELRQSLEIQIKLLNLENDIHLLGFVDNPFVYMKKADAFVLSSSWEGFGNVLAEALSLGTQVVSTNCPSGPAEILDNGKYGFLVRMNDIEALAEAMLKAIEQPIDEKCLIKRGHDFTLAKIAKQYQQVLL